MHFAEASTRFRAPKLQIRSAGPRRRAALRNVRELRFIGSA